MAVGFVLMVIFAALLAKATLEPSNASVGIAHSNLRPGASLRQYFERYTAAGAVRQVGGNLALGVPFGLLLPVIAPKARGALRVVLATATVMVLVELVQGAVVPGRAFDIDDVILNTSGALLGYLLLGRRLGRAVHRRRPAPAARRAEEESSRAVRTRKPTTTAKPVRPAKTPKPAPAAAGTGAGTGLGGRIAAFRRGRRPAPRRP